MNAPDIHLSPALRIAIAGCTWDAKTTDRGQYKLLLKRGNETVALAYVSRSSNCTVGAFKRRVSANDYPPSTAVYQVMARYADIAETLNKNV